MIGGGIQERFPPLAAKAGRAIFLRRQIALLALEQGSVARLLLGVKQQRAFNHDAALRAVGLNATWIEPNAAVGNRDANYDAGPHTAVAARVPSLSRTFDPIAEVRLLQDAEAGLIASGPAKLSPS